ncbi:DUF4190 domain-containing protein [Curtobacterium flaccumfaciens pv. flaccumfaciens]|uniref:DUF4190 domain-containing protein n=1 Tax=Curtobacterium poinsettiae TaxID=159612 RepID=UPI00217E8E8D|nr:DUF4190 domain-containing protein [Curtobacterium flaccumfaciens]MCS6576363.1 DUF4190 domain-containing protein [Curtobacterium flaccumfaciens pv. flaccumfaciens]WNY33262.1 DUF4190 domain-containing protein [Curtobacterium flaccumfaciens]
MTTSVQPDHARTAQPAFNKLSIIGFVLAFFISAAGLIVGIIALVQTRKRGERGGGLAIAAIILSIVQIIGSSIWLAHLLNS